MSTTVVAQVGIGREEAREAARRELAEDIYHRDDPSLVARALNWLVERLQDVLSAASGAAPGGWSGLLGVLALLVLVAIAIRWRTGAVHRGHGRGQPLLSGTVMSAEQHRRTAQGHAEAAEWAEAVRERLRAIARDLEERAILEPRPGRTADELATESGALLPTHSDELHRAVRRFDDIWYGKRAASQADYTTMRELDVQLREVRPALAGSPS